VPVLLLDVSEVLPEIAATQDVPKDVQLITLPLVVFALLDKQPTLLPVFALALAQPLNIPILMEHVKPVIPHVMLDVPRQVNLDVNPKEIAHQENGELILLHVQFALPDA